MLSGILMARAAEDLARFGPSAARRHPRHQQTLIALRRNRRAAPWRQHPIPAVSGMGRNVHPFVPRRHAAFRRQGSARWTPLVARLGKDDDMSMRNGRFRVGENRPRPAAGPVGVRG